jgi:predicted outer membrane repeat protein
MNLNGGGYGGGVYSESNGVSFTLDDGIITGNKAFGGAGVLISGEGSTFTMLSGSISNNIASNLLNADGSVYAPASGGGVDVGAGVSFTLSGGEISGNTSETRGGGIYGYGANIVFNMNGGVIKNNTANSGGGGVHIPNTTPFNGDPTIGGTTAPASGGWIHSNAPVDVYRS